MENKEKFQIAVKVTILGMIVYVCVLLFSGIEVKPERVIDLYNSIGFRGEIQLPFEVSVWWNLLVFPLIIFISRYACGHDEIAGREPHSQSANLKLKHEAKATHWMLTLLAMVFLGFMILCAIIVSALIGVNSLLSGVLSGIYFALCVYAVLGCGVVAMMFILPIHEDFQEEVTTTEKYLIYSENLLKIGLLKTFPIMIGLTAGFCIRIVLQSIWRFFKKLSIGFKRSPVS